MMSVAGVEWQYRVTNPDSTDPPIDYQIGTAWSEGGPGKMIIGKVRGLAAICTHYLSVPGLGGRRQLASRVAMSGHQEIIELAARLQLQRYSWKHRFKFPEPVGIYLDVEATLGVVLTEYNFMCGSEIAEHAGVTLKDRFLDVWQPFALAAYNWPMRRWGHREYKFQDLKVETCEKQPRQLCQDEAQQLFEEAEAWSRVLAFHVWGGLDESVDDRDLTQCLDEDLIVAAIDVTTKQGSISELRHALRRAGYLR